MEPLSTNEQLVRVLPPTRKHHKSDTDIQKLFTDFWQWRLEDEPQIATYAGNFEQNTELNDLSLQSYERRYIEVNEFLRKADALQPFAADLTEMLHLNALKHELQVFADGYRFKGFLMPINSIQGVHVNLENIFDWMPRDTYGDFKTILTRLSRIPVQIDQIIDLMKEGVEQGITSHRVSIEKLPEALRRHIVDKPEQSPFYAPFDTQFSCEFDEALQDLQNQAKDKIEHIVQAFKELRHYILEDYVTRPSIAISSITNGREYYQQCIKYHTSTKLSAETIHRMGKEEVNRISIEMEKLVSNMGYDMTVKDFSNYIKENPRNYYRDAKELVDACNRTIFERIAPKLNTIFHHLPSIPIEVKSNPLPTAGTAYHENPSLDGNRPGYFVIGTHDPETWPKYTLLSLSLHEANPGHHLQASHVIQSPREPLFRKLTGAGAAYGSCPSQFPSYSYYLEGWALYAETLGFDMNLYTDPLERFGHYSQELLRACRLVVDTGIHAFGWSRERAIAYMLSHIAFTRPFVENQIDRYITWPGQALSYKVGQMKIIEMRRTSEQLLGNKFNLKDFHKIVLDSFGSLAVVEKEVIRWAESQLYI